MRTQLLLSFLILLFNKEALSCVIAVILKARFFSSCRLEILSFKCYEKYYVVQYRIVRCTFPKLFKNQGHSVQVYRIISFITVLLFWPCSEIEICPSHFPFKTRLGTPTKHSLDKWQGCPLLFIGQQQAVGSLYYHSKIRLSETRKLFGMSEGVAPGILRNIWEACSGYSSKVF